MRALGWLVRLGLAVLVLLVGLWGGAALWFRGPSGEVVRGALAGAFALLAISAVGALVLGRGRRWVRGFGLAALLVVVWWSTLQPRNDRNWLPDVAQLPTATVEGDRLTIRNVRNFDYRSETDFTPRWEERTYDLSRLRGIDFFLSYWGSPMIAHTIVSWEFDDGQYLPISIETRKEQGESYSAVRGFFKEYEVYYVVADERDVIRLRSNYRGEQVYLYRLKMPPERARALLLDYVREINELAEQPRWYDALTHNCTTTIRYHARQVGADNPWNWRILVTGYLDQLGYARGTIDTSLPFAELKQRSNITDRAHAADQAADFSQRIRDGLPNPRLTQRPG